MPVRRRQTPIASRWFAAAEWSILAWLSLSPLRAAEIPAPPVVPPAKGSVLVPHQTLKEISPGVFELGALRLDKNRRTLSFPAVVNLRAGNLEYLLVTTTGKTHESLLRTEIQPIHLQVGFLLLGATGAGTNALPEDPSQPLPGRPVEIELSWSADGQRRHLHGGGFVHDRRTGAAMTPGHWIFTGSCLRESGFAAQIDGSIISLITDADALVNNPRPGREDDDNWLVRTNDLPALNAAVEVTFRLANELTK